MVQAGAASQPHSEATRKRSQRWPRLSADRLYAVAVRCDQGSSPRRRCAPAGIDRDLAGAAHDFETRNASRRGPIASSCVSRSRKHEAAASPSREVVRTAGARANSRRRRGRRGDPGPAGAGISASDSGAARRHRPPLSCRPVPGRDRRCDRRSIRDGRLEVALRQDEPYAPPWRRMTGWRSERHERSRFSSSTRCSPSGWRTTRVVAPAARSKPRSTSPARTLGVGTGSPSSGETP